MLLKLQRKTLIPVQLIGYTLTVFIGISILLITTQLYSDIKPILQQQSEVFTSETAVISKNISVFKTIKKDKIYFTDDEISELERQPFAENISKFNTATFKIYAFSEGSEDIPVFYTDLFFESIPDEYIDVASDDWNWDESLDFIPIVIPENYLNLYNFGFAESQGLPVLSRNTISQIEFNIKISGNQKSKEFKSKIVGFTNKINSILVPEDFLLWANKEYGRVQKNKTSRVLVEFKDPTDEAILSYFNENNYAINKEKLEFSKIIFFFKSALIVVFAIAVIIIALSISFILLSLNLIIQKNKELILNLYNIGYNHRKIARFYQVVISTTTIISILFAIVASIKVRSIYTIKLAKLFDFTTSSNIITSLAIILIFVLLLTYNLLLIRNIKKITTQLSK